MWLLTYGPALLNGMLKEEFHSNILNLNKIYDIAKQYEIAGDSLSQVRQLCREFVRDFQRLYYGGIVQKMPACTINVHSILHLPDIICDLGPICYYSQFPMERF